jgi:hypothetical protein
VRSIREISTPRLHQAAGRRTAFVMSAVAILGLLGLPANASATTAAKAPSCRTGVLISAPGSGTDVELNGISALSPNDVWAVGGSTKPTGTVVYRPLIEHWNGTAWSIVKAPRPMPDITFYGVKAISPGNVWAVGLRSQTQVSQDFPVIVHWNGTAWSVVKSPSVDGFLGTLAVASPTDIWAVGIRQKPTTGLPFETLAEHWNGHTWSVVHTLNPSKYGNVLGGVTVAGPNDVWVTGQTGINPNADAPLSERWNGHVWSVVRMPAENFNSGVGSVTSAGPDDLWASGWYDVQTPTGTEMFTLAEHWNGKTWSVDFPPSPTDDAALSDIAAVSANDIWAVGNTAINDTFLLHWNGESWRQYPARAETGNDNVLWSVSAPTATDVWASGGVGRAISEYICPAGA